MELLVVRHALAYERDAKRWPDDRERPLQPLGIRRFRSAARGLARLTEPPDALWSSRYVRAWRTATLLQEEARWPAASPHAELEEGLDPARVLRAVAAAGIERLALVGHAPGLDELAAAALLGRRAPIVFELRKGGVACLRFDGAPRAGTAALEWLATPRLLRTLDV